MIHDGHDDNIVVVVVIIIIISLPSLMSSRLLWSRAKRLKGIHKDFRQC